MRICATIIILMALSCRAQESMETLRAALQWELCTPGLSTTHRALDSISGGAYAMSNGVTRSGTAYLLDGTNDFIAINGSPLDTVHTSGTWSIEWLAKVNVAPGAGQEKFAFGNAIGSGDVGFLVDYYDTGATPLFYLFPLPRIDALNCGAAGTNWTHYVVTMSAGGLCKAYRDGAFVQQRTNLIGWSSSASTYATSIGCANRAGGNFFSGWIALVAKYTRDLTHDEVRALRAARGALIQP